MSTTRAATAAPVLEVFASIQGEGAFVGEAQVFVRLRGCPLRCGWCDTPGSWDVPSGASARVAAPEGPRREAAWASPFQTLTWISTVEPRDPRTVSLTGGEPLVWPDYVHALARLVRPRRLHLETAGGHPEALARVLDVVDHVSLDLKLPEDLRAPVELDVEGPEGARPTGERAPRDAEEWRVARRRCLSLVRDRDAALKLVVAGGRDRRDFQELLEDAARLAPDVPLFLQPATPLGGATAPDLTLLTDLLEDARDLSLAVRVVPQVHRALRIP